MGTLAGINLGDNRTYWQNRSLESEIASVGYFTTTLLNDVKIEIAASNHTSLVRYTFPTQSQNQTFSLPSTPDLSQTQTENDAHILVDLTHVLPAYQAETQSYSQNYLQGEIHIRSGPQGPSYHGKASYAGGWPNIGLYDIHFCGNFTVPAGLVPSNEYVRAVGTNRVDGAGTLFWQYNLFEPPTDAPEVRSYVDAYTQIGNKMGLGALFSWTPSSTAPNNGSGAVIESKIGISHISAEQACSYVASEMPESTSFDDLVEQARSEWESRVLSTVEVVDGNSTEAQNDTLKRMLYTALYHSAVLPTDKTGEIPLWTSNDSFPYFDDHYVSQSLNNYAKQPWFGQQFIHTGLTDTLGHLSVSTSNVPPALHRHLQSHCQRTDQYLFL